MNTPFFEFLRQVHQVFGECRSRTVYVNSAVNDPAVTLVVEYVEYGAGGKKRFWSYRITPGDVKYPYLRNRTFNECLNAARKYLEGQKNAANVD